MLVSIIITTCNREPQILKEALDSIVSQSYTDFEIILVNDSPKYEKRQEVESYISSVQHEIKYIVNETPQGANYARNLGVHYSKGEIISFLDDDDYWHKDRLKKIVTRFENGAEIVYSDFFVFSDRRIRYSKRVYPSVNNQIANALAGNYLGGFSNVSFTRNAFYKCGRLDESMPSYQDQDLFIRLLEVGRLAYINEGLSYYRINPKSISLNSKKKIEGLTLFLKKYDYLFKQYPDSKRRRLESELIYARKQGWSHNARLIKTLLSAVDNPFRIFKADFKGRVKYFAVKVLKLQ